VLLFVATVVVVVSATASWPAMMDHGRLWAQLATIGLAASGFSLSLRTATPNVAVSAIAALSGFWFARLVAGHHLGAFPAALAMLATAAAIGAVCAVLVALVRLPAWAVTLVGMLLLQGVVYLGADRTSVPIHLVGEQDSLFFLFAGVFITGSIGGGVLFAFPVVRAALNRNRPAPPDGEPQPALGGPATTGWTGRLLGAAVGLVGSSVLAGLSGILLAMYVSAGNAASGTNVVYALAPVLIGGVSVVSARGGVFGVVLGMVLVTYAQFWLQLEGASSTVVYLVIALVALVGLLLGGGLEVAGRAVRRLTARGGR
jgi:ribose/xylose/arabinose/galactoside ABC-type transport system permease subunit